MVNNLNLDKNKIHCIFLFILALNYLIPYFLFGNITLFSLDALDSEIPYNNVIGKILGGDFESIKIFLNGEISISYLRRIFHSYSFLYSILNLELAYWTIDVLVKFTSYISFYCLAKKINKNFFVSSLIACLYASSNLPTHEGFGLAIFPYLIYLMIFKKHLKYKHYFIIVFFGLNTDFIFTAFALPSFILLILIIIGKERYMHVFKIFSLFIIPMIVSNINLFYLNFQEIDLHRVEFIRKSNSLTGSIIFFIKSLSNLPTSWDFSFFKKLPYTLFYVPVIFFSFLSKDKNVRKILFVLICTAILLTLIKSEHIGNFINQHTGLIRKLSWSYMTQSYNLLFCLLAIFLLNFNNIRSKVIFLFICLSVLLFQMNSTVVPFYKQKVLKTINYKNIYTFRGYYNFYNFEKIQKTVKEKRVMSVGLDPMIATIHNIYVIDGYHSIYPLSYKKKFRKIIEPELNANKTFKEYYDDWGSRIYTTLYEPFNINKIEFNYAFAKKLGAEFIISKYKISSNKIELIYNDCLSKKGICLYKIL